MELSVSESLLSRVSIAVHNRLICITNLLRESLGAYVHCLRCLGDTVNVENDPLGAECRHAYWCLPSRVQSGQTCSGSASATPCRDSRRACSWLHPRSGPGNS